MCKSKWSATLYALSGSNSVESKSLSGLECYTAIDFFISIKLLNYRLRFFFIFFFSEISILKSEILFLSDFSTELQLNKKFSLNCNFDVFQCCKMKLFIALTVCFSIFVSVNCQENDNKNSIKYNNGTWKPIYEIVENGKEKIDFSLKVFELNS